MTYPKLLSPDSKIFRECSNELRSLHPGSLLTSEAQALMTFMGSLAGAMLAFARSLLAICTFY